MLNLPTTVFGVEDEAGVDSLVCYSNALICAEAQTFVPKHHLLSVLVLLACLSFFAAMHGQLVSHLFCE